jgi:AAA domain
MTTQDVASENPPARRDRQFDYQSPEDVCNETVEEPSWIWHGFLGAGLVTLLTSLWKCGKTTLLSVLLARMGSGGTLAGRIVRPGRVAVISEEPRQLWPARIRRLQIGAHVRFLIRPFGGRRPTHEQWLTLIRDLARRHEEDPLSLIVVDALSAFVPGGSENHAGSMLDMLLPLQELTDRGVSVLILHHPKKGVRITGQAARGTGAIVANSDIVIEMDGLSGPTDDDRRRKLASLSRHAATPRRLVIEWTADGTDYTALGDFDAAELDDGRQVLFWVLEDADKKLTRQEILKNWPADYRKPEETTVWRWLERGVEAGRIFKQGTGRKNEPYRYWLDGMEEVWQSDPFYLEPLQPIGDELGVRRKTLADVMADRKSEAEAKVKRAARRRRAPDPTAPADAAPSTPAPDAVSVGGEHRSGSNAGVMDQRSATDSTIGQRG